MDPKNWENLQRDCDIFGGLTTALYGPDTRFPNATRFSLGDNIKQEPLGQEMDNDPTQLYHPDYPVQSIEGLTPNPTVAGIPAQQAHLQCPVNNLVEMDRIAAFMSSTGTVPFCTQGVYVQDPGTSGVEVESDIAEIMRNGSIDLPIQQAYMQGLGVDTATFSTPLGNDATHMGSIHAQMELDREIQELFHPTRAPVLPSRPPGPHSSDREVITSWTNIRVTGTVLNIDSHPGFDDIRTLVARLNRPTNRVIRPNDLMADDYSFFNIEQRLQFNESVQETWNLLSSQDPTITFDDREKGKNYLKNATVQLRRQERNWHIQQWGKKVWGWLHARQSIHPETEEFRLMSLKLEIFKSILKPQEVQMLTESFQRLAEHRRLQAMQLQQHIV